MRVNVYQTVEVTDEEREKIATVLHGQPHEGKTPQATRAEIKEYVWANGSDWEAVLEAEYAYLLSFPGEDLKDLL